MPIDYYAHIRRNVDGTIKRQTIEEHCRHTAEIASELLEPIGAGKAAYLSGYLHDMGKCKQEFQEYLEKSFNGQNVTRGSVVHTFAGVKYVLENYHNNNSDVTRIIAEIIAYAIGAHHGLFDVYVAGKENGFIRRLNAVDTGYEESKQGFLDNCIDAARIDVLMKDAEEERGNVLLRTKQHLISQDEAASCSYARMFIFGKIYNARWVLERATRDHSLRVPVEKIKETSSNLANSLSVVRNTTELSRLRGIEGEAAQLYFAQFNSLILQQKTEFVFNGRSKRPPMDNVNALLSFAYTILANNCAAALQSVGLDPYVGFMHRLRPGRSSLALDLMEELRPVIADRFVLSCINKKIITAKHFDEQESGAVWLNEDGRKVFFKAWQERKQEYLTHPFLNEKVSWGLVPYTQALLLARSLRGDLDDYPPFLWK